MKKGQDRLDLLEEICGPSTQRFLLRIRLQPGMHILDVGCGIGNTSLWLAAQNPDLKVIGIDNSSEQLVVAKSCAEKKQLKMSNLFFPPLTI